MIDRMKVYRNLHNGKWSIMSTKNNLVMAHANHIILSDVVFKVNEKGRQRAILEKRKNVHAFAEGIVDVWNGQPYKNRRIHVVSVNFNVDTGQWEQVSYNPYHFSNFFNVETLDIINNVKYAYFSPDGKLFVRSNINGITS